MRRWPGLGVWKGEYDTHRQPAYVRRFRYRLRGTLSLGGFCRWRGRFEVTPVIAVSVVVRNFSEGTLPACQTEWSGQQYLEQHYLMKLYQLGGMFEVASPQGGSLCPLVHARLTT